MPAEVLIPSPTSFDPAYNQQCWPEYARAVEQAGAQPVLVPLDTSEAVLRDLCRTANGILLPGSGADVSPALYGHDTQPETAPADPARERIDRLLLEHAHAIGTPTLAVCFGLQSLNVFRGGTLVQHLQPLPVNHSAGRAVMQAHATLVAAESRLGRLIQDAADLLDAADLHEVANLHDAAAGGFLRLMINSSHHQAVGFPGDGLRITARSTEDGVIEAVEDAAHPFLIGVQWHPERTMQQSDASRRLVEGFVEAAKRHG